MKASSSAIRNYRNLLFSIHRHSTHRYPSASDGFGDSLLPIYKWERPRPDPRRCRLASRSVFRRSLRSQRLHRIQGAVRSHAEQRPAQPQRTAHAAGFYVLTPELNMKTKSISFLLFAALTSCALIPLAARPRRRCCGGRGSQQSHVEP
jgi:hypothetical protein